MTAGRRSPPVAAIRGPEHFARTFDVSRETVVRLTTYESLLRQWQKAVNLVAPSTLDAIWHRHFADSAQLIPLAPAARTWVDLGSGAGFPGLVIAILLGDRSWIGKPATSPSPLASSAWGEDRSEGRRPPLEQAAAPHPNPAPAEERGAGTGAALPIPRITLIESNARKCAFLREVVRQTGIAALQQPGASVDILSTRIEIAATQTTLHGPDVVSARALAPLDKLLALAAPLFTSSTVGLFLKGRDAAAELKAAEGLWNFNVELVPSRTEPGARIAVVRNLERKNEGMIS
jgi:16S rRNA (guanine527-N7)-methyltransferase